MRAVVVGAGIAGLAVAWELLKGRCDVTVLESERRIGGIILTERLDGFVVEGGPDGWLAAETEIPRLAAELGVANRVVPQVARGSFLWTGTALQPLEEGKAATLLGITVKNEQLTAGFMSFASGMGELVEALASHVGSTVRSPLGVSGITPTRRGWRVAVTGGAVLEADAVVLAIPAYSAGRLLEQAGVKGARQLGDVVYSPSVTVSLAFRADQVGKPLAGTGFVVSNDASLQVRACTYSSLKFPGRAPEGHVLLRAFLAPGDGDPATQAHGELTSILDLKAPPLWSRAFYWVRGIPRYSDGHAEQVAEARARLTRLAPLAIAGAGYDGAGVSACVRSGREAGRQILQRLSG
jgi:oxygen-dependent protoporphyrinogen oxidase